MSDSSALNAKTGAAPEPPPREYRLHGPQAEPTSAFWLDEPVLRVPSLAEIGRYTRQQDWRFALSPDLFPDDNLLSAEFSYLQTIERQRDDESGYPLTPYEGPPRGDFTGMTPLSRFLQLRDPPFGTIFDTDEAKQIKIDTVDDQHERLSTDPRLVTEGQELARIFEEETPGLYHRHALNWLLYLRSDIAPPRHARIWLALDMAIYAALGAAWFYKWRGENGRLLRPSEYATRNDLPFTVHFDTFVNPEGFDEGNNEPRPGPGVPPGAEAWHPFSPGTPRHPAWSSGHSTYSAAASYILEWTFSPDTIETETPKLFKDYPSNRFSIDKLSRPGWIAAELRRLANNIGEARLWGGVHWISDHVAGQRIGRAAAQAVIDAFQRDVICSYQPPDPNLPAPPTPEMLAADWARCRENPNPRQDTVPVIDRSDRQAMGILPPT